MKRLPEWLRRPLPGPTTQLTHNTLAEFKLNTVCESARCPNRAECYSQRTATFMILGDVCTRRCGFCAITTGKPKPVEADEPIRVAKAAARLGLKHVVVTSVARDELQDEGADAFFQTLRAIREALPEATVEILTPDFHARRDLIAHVCEAQPNVFNHNLETVSRLQSKVRPQARYERSLDVLRMVKEIDSKISTKSGVMLGLGEEWDEVKQTLSDIRAMDVDILTVGQYLKPGAENLEVEKFIHPELFAELEEEGKRLGFREVYSGPYVRSSYHAGETYANSLVEVGGLSSA